MDAFSVVGVCRTGKKDYSTAILERKKATNRLVVDEATNDDKNPCAAPGHHGKAAAGCSSSVAIQSSR
nr:unnamed protein product [Digitaria exilis]